MKDLLNLSCKILLGLAYGIIVATENEAKIKSRRELNRAKARIRWDKQRDNL